MKNANLLSILLRGAVIFAAGVTSPSFLSAADAPKEAPAARGANEFFIIRIGDKPLQLQVAASLPEMQRGLMERRNLQPNEGMLFVYEKPQAMSFWMRNTPLPLHIGFFDSMGILRETYPLFPYDENTLKSRSDSLQFAVEVRQNWFRENGILPGTPLDLNAVRVALQARGLDPAKFGLRK